MGYHKHPFTTYLSIASCIYISILVVVCKFIHTNITEHAVHKKSNLKKDCFELKILLFMKDIIPF